MIFSRSYTLQWRVHKSSSGGGEACRIFFRPNSTVWILNPGFIKKCQFVFNKSQYRFLLGWYTYVFIDFVFFKPTGWGEGGVTLIIYPAHATEFRPSLARPALHNSSPWPVYNIFDFIGRMICFFSHSPLTAYGVWFVGQKNRVRRFSILFDRLPVRDGSTNIRRFVRVRCVRTYGRENAENPSGTSLTGTKSSRDSISLDNIIMRR